MRGLIIAVPVRLGLWFETSLLRLDRLGTRRVPSLEEFSARPEHPRTAGDNASRWPRSL